MTVEACLHCDEFLTATEAAHERALAALTRPADGAPFDAVVWLSAHLAAVTRVVHPVLRRHLPDAAAALRDQRSLDHRLTHAVRTLEQVTAGDALAARETVTVARERVAALLAEHSRTEHALLDAVAQVIGPEDTRRLEQRYERALAHAPTRPHPHEPRRGPLGAMLYLAAGLRDHALDVMDSRHVPLPRQRQVKEHDGRWTHYLLGQQRRT